MSGTVIADAVPVGAVAFAIELPDGSISLLGWMDMRLFESASQVLGLTEGCRYVFASPAPQWRPIAEAPCDDTVALSYDEQQGRYGVVDFDHDSDPAYWAEHGLTHWMPLPPPPETAP
jgi:hypothetical protein